MFIVVISYSSTAVTVLPLRTPEYPAGREVIIIGNDLTIKAGYYHAYNYDEYLHYHEYCYC